MSDISIFKESYKVLSLFSGCGGFDLGFQKSGFKIVWANDCWKPAVETYRANLGDHITLANIRTLRVADTPDAEAVIGGFPCVTFSKLGKRDPFDERGFLFTEYLRFVCEKRPKVIVWENIPELYGFLAEAPGQEGKFLQLIRTMLEQAGYRVDFQILNSADFLVPQTRRRLFCIANRIGVENIFPTPLIGKPLRRYDIVQIVGGQDIIANDYLNNEQATRILQRINQPDRKAKTWPELIVKWTGDACKPFPTLTASCGSFGAENAYYVEFPTRIRRFTPLEVKLGMGFPEDFNITGSRSNQYKQLGNAVCPPVSKAIAECVRQMLDAEHHV